MADNIYCIKCRYFHFCQPTGKYLCTHKESEMKGGVISEHGGLSSCIVMRMSDHPCGKTGKLFATKPDPLLKRFIARVKRTFNV